MKTLLTISIFILLSITSYAQLNFGVQAGYCRVGGYDTYKYKGSGMGGAFVRYSIKPFLVALEANYVGRGGSKPITYTDANNNSIGGAKAIINNAYLQIPLLVGGLIKSKNCNFFVKGGGFYSFLLSSKYILVPPASTGNERTTYSTNGNNDFGLIASAGLELKTLLFFELRAEQGLNSISNASHSRNTAISLIIGLRFGKN